MRILDLFSGLGGFSEPFRDRGHEVITLDIDSRFEPDIVADVREIRYPSLSLDGEFDVVLASPPCEAFSIARAWHGWPPELQRDGLALVACTFQLIADIQPKWHVVENPRGFLRNFINPPKQTIHLCDWGGEFQKPTDLWGHYPGDLPVPNRCAPHIESPNAEVAIKGVNGVGSARAGGAMAVYTSGSGKNSKALRAKLPYGLGEELCKRMEAL